MFMPADTERNTSQQLSDEVINLIQRILSHKRTEYNQLLDNNCCSVYSVLTEEMKKYLFTSEINKALITIPLKSYDELCIIVENSTKEWPDAAWNALIPILSTQHLRLDDSKIINRIIDEFTWAISDKPFTLDQIAPEKIKAYISHVISSYGITINKDVKVSFDRQLKLAAAASQSEIPYTARHSRIGVGIKIDEYLLSASSRSQTQAAHHNNFSPTFPSKNNDDASIINAAEPSIEKESEIKPLSKETDDNETIPPFDALPLSGIAKMFKIITDETLNLEEWKEHSGNAARNKLINSRVIVGRGKRQSTFDPQLVGDWLVNKGYLTQEKVTKSLGKNLPSRSQGLLDFFLP